MERRWLVAVSRGSPGRGSGVGGGFAASPDHAGSVIMRRDRLHGRPASPYPSEFVFVPGGRCRFMPAGRLSDFTVEAESDGDELLWHATYHPPANNMPWPT